MKYICVKTCISGKQYCTAGEFYDIPEGEPVSKYLKPLKADNNELDQGVKVLADEIDELKSVKHPAPATLTKIVRLEKKIKTIKKAKVAVE